MSGGKAVSVPIGLLYIGLQVTGTGPYTVYASGGGDNNVKLFTISATGTITQNGQNAVSAGSGYTFVPQTIKIAPITPTPGVGHELRRQQQQLQRLHSGLPDLHRQQRLQQLRAVGRRRAVRHPEHVPGRVRPARRAATCTWPATATRASP